VTEGATGGRIRVMVVHGHPVVSKGLADCLDCEPDLEVVGTAPTCGLALDMAAELRPDVVLIGRSTPWTGGLEATRHLIDAQPDLLVAILSGSASHEFMAEALQSGAIGYLHLDTPPSEIAGAVRRLLMA